MFIQVQIKVYNNKKWRVYIDYKKVTLNRTPPNKGDHEPPETSSNVKRSINDLLNESSSPPELQLTKKPNNSSFYILTTSTMGRKHNKPATKCSSSNDNIYYNVTIGNKFSALNNSNFNNTNYVNNADMHLKKRIKFHL